MTQETKTAIKSAEERLEKETNDRLQAEVYDYLKSQLNELEDHKSQKRFHEGEIHRIEENIKNLKSGNLEAIEKRRQARNEDRRFTVTWSTNPAFFNQYVAGFTYTSPFTGQTYYF